MATKLNKKVTMELVQTGVRVRGGKYASLLVTLEPGDMITFRAKGTRRRFSISLGHCMNLAEIMDAEHKHKEALELHNLKKKAGIRSRRPKKPGMWYAKIYYDALRKGLSKMEDSLSGTVLGKCPECGEELQYGIGDKLLKKFKNSRLFKNK